MSDDKPANGQSFMKYAGTLTAILVAAFALIVWAFQVKATADAALAISTENRQTIKESLEKKADKDDINDLRQDVRDLRDDFDSSAFVRNKRH